MAKFKTRMQYNSMGERVVVRTAVESIDAFAARSQQCSSSSLREAKQRHGKPRGGGGGETGGEIHEAMVPPQVSADGAVAGRSKTSAGQGLPVAQGTALAAGAANDAVAAWNPQDGGTDAPDDVGYAEDDGRDSRGTPTQSRALNVSKSLGFGWPDFSSIGSKVRQYRGRR